MGQKKVERTKAWQLQQENQAIQEEFDSLMKQHREKQDGTDTMHKKGPTQVEDDVA